jgi:hypothetical protein
MHIRTFSSGIVENMLDSLFGHCSVRKAFFDAQSERDERILEKKVYVEKMNEW